MRMAHTADQTFLFGPTGFSRMAETLAVVALRKLVTEIPPPCILCRLLGRLNFGKEEPQFAH